jgi:hypothetical protein
MSVLGQKPTSESVFVMSALPPRADIAFRRNHVRFVPIPDLRSSERLRKVDAKIAKDHLGRVSTWEH